MDTKAIIVANIYTRKDKLIRLMRTMKENLPEYHRYKIYIVSQGYGEREFADMQNKLMEYDEGNVFVLRVDELVGAHNARLRGLQMAYDAGNTFFVNLDDDVTMLKTVNYEPIFKRLKMDKNVGFVTAGWSRSLTMAMRIQPKDEFVKQKIIYTGGGLCYRRDVAEIILRNGFGNLLYDDTEWSMRAYINGYENYRYRGSMVIAEVGNNDGRRKWTKVAQRDLPDPKLINIRKTRDDFAIPVSSDLTAYAHELHNLNKK